jgi:hypothetical protein
MLIAAIALSAYSTTGLTLNVFSPSLAQVPDKGLIISTPVIVNNRGIVDLKDLNITTHLCSPIDFTISESSTVIPLVAINQELNFTQNMTIANKNLFANGNFYLFEDQNLTFTILGKANFLGLLPTTLATNTTFLWGAPFHNFTIGNQELKIFNDTNSLLTVQLSFVNHAYFDLYEILNVTFFDVNHFPLATDQVILNTASLHSYNGELFFLLPSSKNESQLSGGHFEIRSCEAFKEYGIWEIPYEKG